MWVTMKLKLFRDANRQLYPVFVCNICDSMNGVDQMTMNSNQVTIENLKCIHREDFQKKHCIFDDIWQIRLLTYLPHPNWEKIIYDNLISISDLPPLQKFGQNPENIWFLKYTIYSMTSLMSCHVVNLDKISNLRPM